MKITDEILTGWLQSYDHWDFGFLKLPRGVKTRKNRSKSIERQVKALKPEQPLHRQRDVLKSLWKDLVSSAIIYLKARDEREGERSHDDGDYGLDELEKYFEKFSDFEGFLFGSSDLYRDHLSHLFRVFLLGEYLLKSSSPCEVGFGDLGIGDADVDLGVTNDEEKEAMWCLMALTHDIGYPIQVYHDINSRLRDMVRLFDVDLASIATARMNPALNDHIVRLIASRIVSADTQDVANPRFQTQVQAKYLWKFLRALENRDHGVQSSILLFKTLVYFLETDYCLSDKKTLSRKDARQFMVRQCILRSIAAHNCDYIYHFRLTDMPFFLRLMDEMQEWDRPRMSDLYTTSLRMDLDLKNVDRESVRYIVTFSRDRSDGGQSTAENDDSTVRRYFAGRAGTYIETLRSAVVGDEDKRALTVRFEVVDRVNDSRYSFVHRSPTDIEIKRNGKPVSLKTLGKWKECK